MDYAVAATGRSHPGRVREHNEDSFHIGRRVIMVADGVGGSAGGEVASQTVTQVFAGIDDTDPAEDVYAVLSATVDDSTDAIARQVREDPSLAGMGTTATVMMCCDRRIVFAQIGDSRAYCLRGAEPEVLQRVTVDDSFVQFLLDTGVIDPAQAREHPQRNIILKAVNGSAVAPSFSTFAPVDGDRYLLCSDGLTDYVSEEDVLGALAPVGPGDETDRTRTTDVLIDLALAAGAPDNVTVIVVDIKRPTRADQRLAYHRST